MAEMPVKDVWQWYTWWLHVGDCLFYILPQFYPFVNVPDVQSLTQYMWLQILKDVRIFPRRRAGFTAFQ